MIIIRCTGNARSQEVFNLVGLGRKNYSIMNNEETREPNSYKSRSCVKTTVVPTALASLWIS